MFTKFYRHMRITAIFSLVFVFALSVAWATNHYTKNKVINIGKGLSTDIVSKSKDRINIAVRNGALDDYMIERGRKKVLLSIHLAETWIDTGDGNGYYQLNFTFGPSGAYFQEPLEVELRGKYVSENSEVQMYDENGEIVEFTSSGNGIVITYYIPHFSNYYYDGYDY